MKIASIMRAKETFVIIRDLEMVTHIIHRLMLEMISIVLTEKGKNRNER